ncbi:uncharacterized protein LY89DRAFT_750161 [Mollisia scopiformis]|uniref:Uncharacterized protein n=1 Tax=Mollisia scopiformis TaxID=149040 RepID=A0A194X7E0_MOLSC|nr:uncharacterized protein LY89DRAFT_750161 [Mollisia scopiformis]KUJ16009.1 hypothetical protein LY89DRAFT_750161 [Mollisia scopiformis]
MFSKHSQGFMFAILFIFFAAANANPGKRFSNSIVEDGAVSTSNFTNLTAQFFPAQGSKRVKVTYGPFNVPNMNIENGMKDFTILPSTVGCSDCLITYIEAGLEFPNGTYANANTSLWLHHTVLYNFNNLDTVCGATEPGERFFASGNERSPADISMNGTNTVGYYVGPEDKIGFLAELMNTEMVNQSAVVTITFEYIPGLPASFNKATPIWLDISGCGGGSDMPAKNDTAFQYTSPVWTANATGRVTCAIGHLHDGGVNLDITKNNQTACDCTSAYGQTPGYMDPMGSSGMMSMPGMTMGTHISSITECSTGQVNLGDNMMVTAYYNTSEYEPMTNTDGTLAPIMGIGLLYLAQNEASSSGSSSTSSASTTATGVASSTSKAAGPIMTVAGGPVLFVGALGGMAVLGFA